VSDERTTRDATTRPAQGAEGPRALRPGEEFAGYRIEAELGRGGMGVVYRARHLALARECALKLIAADLAADERFVARFRRESRLAASIEHANVVPVYDAGEERGVPFIAMRLIAGDDLAALVEREGPLELERAGRIVRQLAAGLDAAHSRGLVHRDVKPHNVLIERGPGGERAYITDFGIGRFSDAPTELTGTGEFLGSPDYVAPEQIEGASSDHRADVYSLAAVAYYLLTGSPPFPNRSEAAKLVAHCKADRPRPSRERARLPMAVDRVIARGMAIDPANRYRTAGEFARALEQALGGHTRRQAIAGTALILAALGAVAAAIIVTAPEPGSPPTPDVRVTPIRAGAGPVAVAQGDERMWVANRGDGTITGIDPRRDRPDRRIELGPGTRPVSIEVAFGSVWVADGAGGAVLRVDADEGTEPVEIPVGAEPSDLVAGRRSLWVAVEGEPALVRVDPDSNAVDATVSLADAPNSVAYADGYVWAVSPDGGTLARVDARTLQAPEVVELGGRPNDVTVAHGIAWVTDNESGTVLAVDAEALEAREGPIEVGARPRGIAAGARWVWVAVAGENAVVRIDGPRARVRGHPVPVGREPADVALGFDSGWTANFEAHTVSRIRFPDVPPRPPEGGGG
jgi:streptogramin lyase